MFAKNADTAAVWRGESQANAKGGGFARAIGTDDPKTLAGEKGKRQVINHQVVAKAFVQMLTLKLGLCLHESIKVAAAIVPWVSDGIETKMG